MSDTLREINRTIEYLASKDRTYASCDMLTLRRWANSFATLTADLAAARAEVERLKYLLTDAQDDVNELENIAINEHRPDRAMWYRMRAKALADALAPKETP